MHAELVDCLTSAEVQGLILNLSPKSTISYLYCKKMLLEIFGPLGFFQILDLNEGHPIASLIVATRCPSLSNSSCRSRIRILILSRNLLLYLRLLKLSITAEPWPSTKIIKLKLPGIRYCTKFSEFQAFNHPVHSYNLLINFKHC